MSASPEHGARTAALRPASDVMGLDRLGASHPTRLSVMRCLIRRLAAERVRFARPVWRIDASGHGYAVYTLSLGGHAYSLVAVSTAIPDTARTDRVIAERWDTAYVLYDGVPGVAEIERIAATAPLQEAARYSRRDIVLSRANKSLRLFSHVVERLAAGAQPDPALVARTGYLMRTTAVYGNGKFGIADRARIAARPGLGMSFGPEMLAVWLIRGFTHDLVEHMARARGGPGAAPLSPQIRRHLGIGNATGLGMAPFLVTHPRLLHAWIAARETALARIRALPVAGEAAIEALPWLLARAADHAAEWLVDDPAQAARIAAMRSEIAGLAATVTADWLAAPDPFERIMTAVAPLSLETQELAISLMLEPHGELIDTLADGYADTEGLRLEPTMGTGALAALIRRAYAWVLPIDFAAAEETSRFWYVSEEKLEPRLGHAGCDPGDEFALPLDIARRVQRLLADLEGDGETSLARFLMRRPQHRDIAARAQSLAVLPYAEVRANLIGSGCRPVDLLRAKLAIFGAAKFDPRSDLWTRVTLFQGAPCAADLADGPDDWAVPALGMPTA